MVDVQRVERALEIVERAVAGIDGLAASWDDLTLEEREAGVGDWPSYTLPIARLLASLADETLPDDLAQRMRAAQVAWTRALLTIERLAASI